MIQEGWKEKSGMINIASNAAPLVSVIVPVYNVEKYLARCLGSIVEQAYQNLEIILANDGSTDGSREICFQYGQRDSRIRLFDQENRGVSAARNTGLDNMKGEYAVFVDSDDYISPCMVETLLRQPLTQHASIAVCNFLEVGDGDVQFDMVSTDGICFCQRMRRKMCLTQWEQIVSYTFTRHWESFTIKQYLKA